MKTAIELLDDLENLYELKKEGGLTDKEFQNAKKERLASITSDYMLSAKHLKMAHKLLSKKVLTQEEYNQIKASALKIKLPQKPVLKSANKSSDSVNLWQGLVYVYKFVLFCLSFVIKLFLGVINFFVINLVVDNLKGKK